MNLRLLISVVFVFLIPFDAFASNRTQVDSLETNVRNEFRFSFRSIQIDAASIYFIESEAVSIDFDLIRHLAGGQSTLGLRFAVERFDIANYYRLEEHHTEFPLSFGNFVIRSTAEGKQFRWDIYTGLSYPLTGGSESHFKFGMEFKWMFIQKTAGLMLKLCVTSYTPFLGLGFVLGLEK